MAVPLKKTGVCDSRAIYTPPCVVKISDLKQVEGNGACASGSGAAGACASGSGAAAGGCNAGTGGGGT